MKNRLIPHWNDCVIDTQSTVRQAERYQVVVHVEQETLSETGGHGRSEIKHGPPLSAETARRIACDAAIIELESDTYAKPLNIGRKPR